MKFAANFERAFRYLLPAPFTIAVVLTLITMALALAFGEFSGSENIVVQLLDSWQEGLWNPPLLAFAVQMMLILVLGHTLALAPAVSRLTDQIVDSAESPSKAAFLVTFSTMLVGFFNWGLGLIFGAIMARKTGERFAAKGKAINYPLIGAAGYAGMMIWHGGLSGSAPLKVVEDGHLKTLMAGVWNDEKLAALPASVPFGETVFGSMNITAGILLLIALPLAMALVARKRGSKIPSFTKAVTTEGENHKKATGAEKLDRSRIFSLIFAFIILGYSIYTAFAAGGSMDFISLNYVNFTLLGLCLLFHKNFVRFLKAVDEAILGAAGILIQFPLYFGIMGMMQASGLITQISGFFISISNETTFPLFTFLSAGLVNIFVPSGGGQWAVQGPIIIQAANELGVSLPKSIMALAYGDQITNMLQPFWALPLLGITGLKAREILPYTLLLLGAGTLIFVSILLIY